MIATDYIFGKIHQAQNTEPNTYIGGIASIVPDKTTLASELGILESDIGFFNISGDDIEAAINVEYTLSGYQKWQGYLTYYDDRENKVIELNSSTFYDHSTLEWAKFNGITQLNGTTFYGCDVLHYLELNNVVTGYDRALGGLTAYKGTLSLPNLTTINGTRFFNLFKGSGISIPKCTQLGDTTGDDDTFLSATGKVYVNPYLETNDNGSPDGCLVSFGLSKVVYVTDQTSPQTITDLSIGTIYANALQINFTPPTSVNEIQFYEVYLDGIFYSKIESAGFVTGLNSETTYEVSVEAVDIYYNRSSSNQATGTTAIGPDISTGLKAYYKLEGNADDSCGTNDGTPNGTAEVVGKIGNALAFNGADTVDIPAPYLSGELSHSLACWIYINSSPASRVGVLVCTPQSPGGEHWLLRPEMTMQIGRWGGGSLLTSTISAQTWTHIATTFNAATREYKVYINGQLDVSGVLTTSETFALSGQIILGKAVDTELKLNGIIDEMPVYTNELSASQILDLYNNGNGITL